MFGLVFCLLVLNYFSKRFLFAFILCILKINDFKILLLIVIFFFWMDMDSNQGHGFIGSWNCFKKLKWNLELEVFDLKICRGDL